MCPSSPHILVLSFLSLEFILIILFTYVTAGVTAYIFCFDNNIGRFGLIVMSCSLPRYICRLFQQSIYRSIKRTALAKMPFPSDWLSRIFWPKPIRMPLSMSANHPMTTASASPAAVRPRGCGRQRVSDLRKKDPRPL